MAPTVEQREAMTAAAQQRYDARGQSVGKGERKRLEEVLEDLESGELPQWVEGGQTKKPEDSIGVLLLTDRRVIYNGKLLTKRVRHSFALDRIDSVTTTSGMMLAEIQITGPGFEFDLKSVNKETAPLTAERVRQAAAEMKKPPTGAADRAAPSPTLVADELRKLAELRDEGILSDEEFAQQKAKLLGT